MKSIFFLADIHLPKAISFSLFSFFWNLSIRGADVEDRMEKCDWHCGYTYCPLATGVGEKVCRKQWRTFTLIVQT